MPKLKQSAQSLSKEVSLPDPKPAIAGSSPSRFLCRNGKIFPLNDVVLKQMVASKLGKADIKPNQDKEYDGKRFLSVINGNKISTNFFTLVGREDKDKVIRFTMERKDKFGEDEAKLKKLGSQYVKVLSSLSPQRNYLLYEVFLTVLGSTWQPVTWPIRETFLPGGSLPTGGQTGGVLTGVTGLWEEKNI